MRLLDFQRMEFSSGITCVLNKAIKDPQAPFEARFVLDPPGVSHAPEAGVRVLRPRAGVLLRTDPYKPPVDRNGMPFRKS